LAIRKKLQRIVSLRRNKVELGNRPGKNKAFARKLLRLHQNVENDSTLPETVEKRGSEETVAAKQIGGESFELQTKEQFTLRISWSVSTEFLITKKTDAIE
jgi:hypothetical protein